MKRKPTEKSKAIRRLRRINKICDYFDRKLAKGSSVSIEDMIAKDEGVSDQRQLFQELLSIELEYDDQKKRTSQEYLKRFPEFAEIIDRVFDQYGLEFVEQTAPFPSLPHKFGRYEIKKKLGAGGMGSVFLAVDTNLDRRVALKVPLFQDDTDQTNSERFAREAKIAARVQHPNMCQVFDSGKIDGVLFIAMGYVDGRPLSDYLSGGKKLSARQAARLVKKLCLALEEAHRLGVTHRDLKPSNIMIDRNNQPVIVDFGLARPCAFADQTITRTGQFVGTPAYMSPEQVKGNPGAVGPAADVFSLGIILYELVAGRRPFDGSIGVIMSQVLKEEPTSLRKYGVSTELDNICRRAMRKNPLDRFASMRDFAQSLDDFLSTQNSHASQAQPVSQEPMTELPNEVVATFQGVSTLRPTPTRTNFSKQRKHKRKSNKSQWVGFLLIPVLTAAIAGGLLLKRHQLAELFRGPEPIVQRPVPQRITPRLQKPTPQPKREPSPPPPPKLPTLAEQWQSAFSSLPARIHLPDASSDTQPVYVSIGTTPSEGELPWSFAIEKGISRCDFRATRATDKLWEIKATDDVVGTISRNDNQLQLAVVTPNAISQLRYCRVVVISKEDQRTVGLFAEQEAIPLLQLNLNEKISRQVVSASVPDMDKVGLEVVSAKVDLGNWQKNIRELSFVRSYENFVAAMRRRPYWEDTNRLRAVKTLAGIVDGLLRKVPTDFKSRIEADFQGKLTAAGSRGVDVSYSKGRKTVRLTVRLDDLDDHFAVEALAQYRDGGWRFLTTEVREREVKTLKNFFENAAERDQIYVQLVAGNRQLSSLNSDIIAAQKRVAENPKSTSARARLVTLQSQYANLSASISRLDKRGRGLGKTLDKQVRALEQYFFLVIVGCGIHENTRLDYRILGPGNEEERYELLRSHRA